MTDERTLSEVDINTIVDRPLGGKSNIIMDATLLTSLMSCPRLTDFRFNHNFTSIDGKSNSLECGSIVHTFMEYYYGSLIKGIKRSDAIGYGMAAAETYISGCKYCTDFTPHLCPACNEETKPYCVECNRIGQIIKPICGHKINEFPGVKNTPKEPDKSNPREKYKTGWAWVLETCQQYVDFYQNDHWIPLFVETVKGEVLYEDDEIRILWKAKLDLGVDTNQGIYPVDHKTMKQNRTTVSMNNQFIGQCIIMKTHNAIINKVGFQTSLKPEEKFKRSLISYSENRLMEWQSEILPYYAKLLLMYSESGYWPPNFDHCESKFGNCAFLPVCEEEPNNRESKIRELFVVGPEWNPTNEETEIE